jgi:hypothetical protein
MAPFSEIGKDYNQRKTLQWQLRIKKEIRATFFDNC